MTKKTMIALGIIVVSVIVIGIVINLFSKKDVVPKQVITVPLIPKPSQSVTPLIDNAAYDSGQAEEDMTRIIIKGQGKDGGEIQSILSEKVIINNQVKDQKELNQARVKDTESQT